jgi:2'-5' RNA ligase
MRAFIAVKIAPALLDAASALQSRLESQCAGVVHWSKPDQMHLTLCFLGDVAAEKIGPLESALRSACGGTRPLALRLERLGCFPNVNRPKVIWLGVNSAGEALQSLAQRVRQATQSFGEHQEDRSFQAHLTLGRIRQARPRELDKLSAAIANTAASSLGEWTANSVELMGSELLPSGARHTVLASMPLSGEWLVASG